jgi:hypothetical protein
MSHPPKFRVYLPKIRKHIFLTAFDAGQLKFFNPFTSHYDNVHDAKNIPELGKPLIQMCSGIEDKNGTLMYEGDIIFWHKVKWFGIVTADLNSQEMKFRCQMKDGYCSLVGMPVVGEVICNGYVTDITRIDECLDRAEEILKKFNLL